MGALVLIVEDDATLRELLTDSLADAGYRVVAAADGAGALGILRSGLRPVVALVDLRMPGMSGEQLLSAMNSDGALAGIPTVIVSAELDAHKIALRVGARGVVAKPVDLDALLEIVASYTTA